MIRWTLAFFIVVLLSACTDAGLRHADAHYRPEPRTAAAGPLDAATTPITLNNIQQIIQLGRLDAPEPRARCRTCLSLDTYLAGLITIHVVWDLVTGEIVSGSERLGAMWGGSGRIASSHTLTADGNPDVTMSRRQSAERLTHSINITGLG